SNESHREKVSFRIWQALTGIEYGAKEEVEFENDKVIGSNDKPFILHAEGIYQVIPLVAGWNWVSFNLEQEDMSRNKVFQSLLSESVDNDIFIKSQSRYAEYDNRYNHWNGDLRYLNLKEGYMVYLSGKPDTLRFVGNPINGEVTVPIKNNFHWIWGNGNWGHHNYFHHGWGWNWIGYPYHTSADVNTVLSGLTPEDGALIKSQDKFAEYNDNSSKWLGDMMFMAPGKAYKLRVKNNGSIVFKDSDDDIDFNPQAFENNMIFTATVDGLESTNEYAERFKVGAFVGDKCHGLAELVYNDEEKRYIAYLMVHGESMNEGENVEFRVIDNVSGQEYVSTDNSVSFET
ncbi:MAG: hypothetical protein MI922_15420, partial [Bacteroidales bacterium]|nr:hypothetical protein [Bacteroidales bacterium]